MKIPKKIKQFLYITQKFIEAQSSLDFLRIQSFWIRFYFNRHKTILTTLVF